MTARKTSAAPTRIWKFGARVQDEAAVLEILRASNRYYNALVAIERARVARYVAIRRRHAPDLAAAEDAWTAADDAIGELLRATKRDRQTHWQESGGERRRIYPPEVRARLDALEAERNRASDAAKPLRAAFAALLAPAREEWKRRATEYAAGGGPRIKSAANDRALEEMMAEDWPDAWREIAASDDAAHAELLAARASCGLATGTYLGVEERFTRAKIDSAPRAPRFRRFDGQGKLQIQTRDHAWCDLPISTRASLRQAPHDPRRKGDQSRMHVLALDQSIPRGERRQVIATVKIHRQPPPDAVVKWAAFVARRIGERNVYEVQFTLEHPSFADAKRPAGQRAPEHVQIGWSRVESGVRVAHWPGGEVVVPAALLGGHEHASAIDSAADRHYGRARRILRGWMARGPNRLTAWHRMGSDAARISFRRACVAYAWHVLPDAHERWKRWKTERRARGEDLYAEPSMLRRHMRGATQEQVAAFWLYCWARKDEHLRQYHADARKRFERQRDAFFRAAAIRIATEFESVTVDGYNVAEMKRLDSITLPGEGVRDVAQHNAQASAAGRFREILLDVMGPRATKCERPDGEKKPAAARKRKPRKLGGGEAGGDGEAAAE